MVVLALAIGVAEQDDFANIPDLQDTAPAAPAAPAAANQEAPPEKRYRVMHECLLCVTEWSAKRLAGGFRMAAAAEGSSAMVERRHRPAVWREKAQLNVVNAELSRHIKRFGC